MSAAEENRTTESAAALKTIVTSAYPALGLAPWMSHYDKRTEAVIVGTKTIADISEEMQRRGWMSKHPDEPEPEQKGEGEEMVFDNQKERGGAGMVAFCLNRLATNMHNFAPSIDGIRTKQGIAWAKANNPGMATQPDQQKKSLGQKLQFWKKDKSAT